VEYCIKEQLFCPCLTSSIRSFPMPSPRLRSVATDLPAEFPDVWGAQELARADAAVVPSGHALLDAQLPGGGWPLGLIEVLQERPEQHVWQLIAPALAGLGGPVVIVGAPAEPFGPALLARGIASQRLLQVRCDKPSARLWAAEQALRCSEVCAVAVWLPQARGMELRRLQIAAQQHSHLAFVFRPVTAAADASPARVRVQLGGSQTLELRILKRRGPPLDEVLQLDVHPPRLAALLEVRKRRAGSAVISRQAGFPTPIDIRSAHGLDRVAAVH
jgi:protein ImuA